MKKILIGCIIILSSTALVQAQVVIGAYGTVNTAFGRLSELTKSNAIGGGLDVRYALPSGLSFGIKGEFSTYNTEPSELGEGNVNVAPVNAMVEYFFRDKKLIPWVGLAFGPTFISYRYVTAPEANLPIERIDGTETAFNIAPTAGLILGVSSTARAFVSVRYDYVFRSGESVLDGDMNKENFSYLPISLGLMFVLKGNSDE